MTSIILIRLIYVISVCIFIFGLLLLIWLQSIYNLKASRTRLFAQGGGGEVILPTQKSCLKNKALLAMKTYFGGQTCCTFGI